MKKLINTFVLFSLFSFTPIIRAAEQDIYLAMGCFWCGEAAFRDHKSGEKLPGVIELSPGYGGGTKPNPTYQSHSGYIETVHVKYDDEIISTDKIMDVFWRNIDFLDAGGQFCDRGHSYESAVFYTNEQQKESAAKYIKNLEEKFNKKVVTPLVAHTSYYIAEDYHQNYAFKNPIRYKYYTAGCGRPARLKQIWNNN